MRIAESRLRENMKSSIPERYINVFITAIRIEAISLWLGLTFILALIVRAPISATQDHGADLDPWLEHQHILACIVNLQGLLVIDAWL